MQVSPAPHKLCLTAGCACLLQPCWTCISVVQSCLALAADNDSTYALSSDWITQRRLRLATKKPAPRCMADTVLDHDTHQLHMSARYSTKEILDGCAGQQQASHPRCRCCQASPRHNVKAREAAHKAGYACCGELTTGCMRTAFPARDAAQLSRLATSGASASRP